MSIADQVQAELSMRVAHAARWGAQLAQVTTEAQAREVLASAVLDEAATVSRLDVAAMPALLGAEYAAFVASAVCTRALDLDFFNGNHPLRETFVGIEVAGAQVLEDPNFITELAREIVRHASARRVRSVAIAMMRAEDVSAEEGPDHG